MAGWLDGVIKRMLYNIHAPTVGSLLVCEQRTIVSNDCCWVLPCVVAVVPACVLHAARSLSYRSPATLPAEM